MKLGSTSDTSARSKVYEISDEIEPAFRQIERDFRRVRLEIFVAFRCLPDRLKRRTFRRYYKQENLLIVDITVSENKYSKLTKGEQRKDLGQVLFAYLGESVTKYKFAGLDPEKFTRILKKALEDIRWLKARDR